MLTCIRRRARERMLPDRSILAITTFPAISAISTISAIMALTLGPVACAPGDEPAAPPARVLVVAVESMGWERVDALLAKGELPHLARLVREGCRGVIVAPDPLDNSMLWTTAYTGKSPRNHRVAGDLANLPDGTRTLMPSALRPTKTMMQIVGGEGRTVLSVGVPMTWPAEVVNGFVVAPGSTPERWTMTEEHTAQRAPRDLATYPPSLFDEIAPLLRDPQGIRREEASRFFTLNELEYGMLYDQPLGSIFRKTNPVRDFGITHQRDLSYVDVTLDLMKRYNPRLVTVHLELLEALQPVYWPFAYPELYETPADSRRRFGNTVDEGHRFIDAQLGRLLEALPPRSTVIVISQRGFGNGTIETEEGPRREAMAHNEGVVVLWGQGIAAGVDLGRVQLTDLTPTVLALFGVPIGGDMDGSALQRAMHPAFVAANPRRTVESYDTEWNQAERYPAGVSVPPAPQPEQRP